MPLLEVLNLKVHFVTDDGIVRAVDGVSYTVEKGRTLGIVGESGSGKSVSSLTVMGLTRFSDARLGGKILFEGNNLLEASDEEMRRIRGNEIAMIFQDPLSSLHPFYRVGDQLVEAIRIHNAVSENAARDRAIEMLDLVGIPEPAKRVDAYPHEFSGGMRQRAMIAMALSNEPKVLIADEPTTALDVTVQAQILELMDRLQREFDTAVIIITHDLGVVAEMAHDIAVMYAGEIVEYGVKERIFAAPEHPYTWGLLKSIPRLDAARDEPLVPISGRPPSLIAPPSGCHFHPRCPYVRERHTKVHPPLDADRRERHASRALPARAADAQGAVEAPGGRRGALEGASGGRGRPGRGRGGRMSVAASAAVEDRRVKGEPLVEVRDLVKHFPLTRGVIFQRQYGAVRAVDGVSFDVLRGETLGLVGESGCGKSTTARLIIRLLDPTSGSIRFDGEDIAGLPYSRLKPLRREMQMIFQDPYASLNPRKTVGSIIARAVQDPRPAHRRGREQARRAGADGPRRAQSRALQPLSARVLRRPAPADRRSAGDRAAPKLVVADEPVSALDVSIQAQVLNLLRELQRDLGLTLIFIAHDLSVVRHMCDRVAVMYLGKIVELATLRPALRASPHALYGRADVRRPGGGSAARGDQEAPGPRRRRALADEPAAGLPLPYALLEGGGDLSPGRADARAQGGRQRRRLSLPADGRRSARAGAVGTQRAGRNVA